MDAYEQKQLAQVYTAAALQGLLASAPDDADVLGIIEHAAEIGEKTAAAVARRGEAMDAKRQQDAKARFDEDREIATRGRLDGDGLQ